MKKDAEHISVNTVRTQINGFSYIMSEADVPSFPSYNCSEHFTKHQWNSPYIINVCMRKLYLYLDFNC